MKPALLNSMVDGAFRSFLHRHSFSPDTYLQANNLLTLVCTKIDETVGYAEYDITYKGTPIAVLQQSWMPEDPTQVEESLSIWTINHDYWGSDDSIRYPLIDGWTMNEPEKKNKLNYFWGRYYNHEYTLYSAKHVSGAVFKYMFKTT